MPKRLYSLNARAICHATEDPVKVEQALRCVVRDAPLKVSRTEGHHGNPIQTLEATLEDEEEIVTALSGIRTEGLLRIRSTVDSRVDESCHLHIRVDKAAAYHGTLELAGEGDVISLRVKVRAFPAKPELAAEVVRGLIEEMVSSKLVRDQARTEP